MNAKRIVSRLAGIGLTAVVAGSCLLAADRARAASDEVKGNRGQLSSHDFKFLSEAAQGGQLEVELGQLASLRGQEADVRDFGQRMVQDHQHANQQLSELVSQKGATLPAFTEGKEQGTVEHLKSLSGADFDRAYMHLMVNDHKKDVKGFQRAAASTKDPDVKSFATKTLPVLEEHLSMAENVGGKVAEQQHRQSKAD